MPNWCKNKLTVYSSSKAQVDAFVTKARGFPQRYPKEEEKEEKWNIPRPTPKEIDLCFHALVPIPDVILAGEYDPTGYEKEVELWGVKWGASDAKLVAQGALAHGIYHGYAVTYSFSTPWGPPEEFLQRLSQLWSDTIFYLSWGSEGETRGRTIASYGELYGMEEDCEIAPGDMSDDEHLEARHLWCEELVGSHNVWLRSMIL